MQKTFGIYRYSNMSWTANMWISQTRSLKLGLQTVITLTSTLIFRQDRLNMVKVIPQQAEVVQRFPCRLRPRIFVTFGITRVKGRQPYIPAAFTPGEIPVTHFQRHMVLSRGAK